MKKQLNRISRLILPLICMSCIAFAQAPTVKSLDRTRGANNDLVTITGTNFGNNASNLNVFFGAMKGQVDFATNQLIEVRVPHGATFEHVSVTNRSSGLTGASNLPFLLSFNGESGLQPSELEGQKDFDTEPGFYGLHDLCACDFDGDLKNDIVGTSEKKHTVSLFSNNTSTPGIANITLNKSSIDLGAFSLHPKCGDLNGDGKPDLVITEGGSEGDRIFIFENTSSGVGSFQFNRSVISLPDKKVRRIEIADIDGNGKPDLIVTNQTGRTLSIIPNTSIGNTIIFSAANAIDLAIPGDINDDKGTDALAVADLNNDHRPEIITSLFITSQSNVYIFQNKSTPGNITFAESKQLNLSGTAMMTGVADLNEDSKPEIVVTLFLASSIAVFENTSTQNDIAFDQPEAIETEERPVGLDFGDLDGNGKTDVVVASLTKRSVTVLINTGTTSAFSFTKIVKSTAYINRHICISDMDGDGKPDIVFTSVDDGGRNIPGSKISIFRNKHCLIPKLLPEGPHQLCSGNTVELLTTPSAGLTYEWIKGNDVLTGENNYSFTATSTGNYSVKTTSVLDNCVLTSNVVNATVVGTPPLTGSPQINDIDPICIGSTLSLQAVDVGASSYKWTGPNGYEGNGLNAVPAITDFQRINAGRYTLEVMNGTCVSEKTSIVIEVFDAPSFKLNADDINVICDSQSKILTIDPQPEGFSYQWYETTLGAIAGQNGTSLVVTNNGSYYAKATTDLDCASGETPSSKIIFADFPNADFDAPETACPDQEIVFTNLSSGNEGLELVYSWNFGDQGESNEANPIHQYDAASTYQVTLKVAYQKGFCPKQIVKPLTIDDSPEVGITTENGSLNICPGETLALFVQGSYETYQWNSGDQTSEITIDEPGLYTATVSTSAGCQGSGSLQIGEFPEPQVMIQATQTQITEGETVQLTASGLQNYLWSPDDALDFAEGPSTNATPVTSTVYTVSGKDLNGCTGEAQIEILVKGDVATTKIIPSKFFSPENGDDINSHWTVEKILNYPRCGVTIFDDKGVTVYESKPYLNDWNGTYNGKPLPDGVYFYVIRCDGEENSPKMGSITLIR